MLQKCKYIMEKVKRNTLKFKKKPILYTHTQCRQFKTTKTKSELKFIFPDMHT